MFSWNSVMAVQIYTAAHTLNPFCTFYHFPYLIVYCFIWKYAMTKPPVWQTALSHQFSCWCGCGVQALNHGCWARSCSVQDVVVLWSRITFCWKVSQQPSWLLATTQLASPVVHRSVSSSLQRQFRLFETLWVGVLDAQSRLLFNAFAMAATAFNRGKETKNWRWLCFKPPHWVISSPLLELKTPTDHGKWYYTEKKVFWGQKHLKSDFFLQIMYAVSIKHSSISTLLAISHALKPVS